MSSEPIVLKEYMNSSAVAAAVDKVALQVALHYETNKDAGEVVALVVLNGAMPFAVDMLRAAALDCRVETIKVSSYTGTSRGEVGAIVDLIGKEIAPRDHVLIVEDIVDTGHTLSKIIRHVRQRYSPESIKVAALLNKECKREVRVPVDFYGAEVGDRFLIGYGLDMNGRYRNLSSILEVIEDKA